MAQQSTGPNHLLNQQSLIGRGDYGAMLAGTRRRDRHPRQRRGVLLLVCLVLLVMFLMLGVTFVLTAGNFRRSSEAYQRMLERPSADLPERSGDLLDSVAHDLVRGTSSQDSPFSEENLLEDLYGRPALRGKVTSALGGQLKELTVTADADFTPSTVRDYYAGLVLTMLTGKCAGKSTRIVGWDGSSQLTVVDFSGSESPATDDLFMVNGRPFSGDGSDTNGRQLNEDYDKADANNPWLASWDRDDDSGEITLETASFAKQADWNANSRPVTITHDDGSTTQVVVDNDGDGEKDSVWMDVGLPLQLQPDGTYVKPLVAMMVRDLDGRVNLNAHGSVTQQNDAQGASAPLGQGYGPAEIDPWHALNIEQDIGFNIDEFLRLRLSEASGEGDATIEQPGSTPENTSQQYAFSQYYQFGSENALITPLDPHGNSFYQSDPTTGAVTFETANGSLTNNFLGTTYALDLDTAQGISRQNTPYAPEDLERMLRFSDADADAIDSRLYKDLAACLSVTEIDPENLKMIRERITTESWDLPVAGLSLPADLASGVRAKISSLNLATKEEAKLSKFLLTGGHITDLFKAKILLVDPVIQAELTTMKEKDANSNPSFDTLFSSFRSQLESRVNPLSFGPGLTRGTRFNVNRLFGNGVDDNSNDVVDDPGEAYDPNGAVTETITAPGFNGVSFDHDGNGSAGEDNDKHARQHYAQQLYLLLMLLADGLESDPAIGSQENLARRLAQFAVNAVDYRDPDSIMTGFEYDAFPFDATGWDVDGDLSTDEGNDGIDNNGNGSQDANDTDPNTNNREIEARHVVWGYEKPVAALTGTMALHDLRIKDTDVGGKTTETEETSPLPPNIPVVDSNYDQYAPPEGSLFLQIYALEQHGINDQAKFPRELYNASGNLELSSVRGGSPVWRVAISEPHAKDGIEASTTTAGANGPLINQLMDSDDTQEVGDEARRQWNKTKSLVPDHTGVPGGQLPSGQTPESVAFENKKKLRFNGDGSGDIVLERVIYFVDQAQINAELDFDPDNAGISSGSAGATYYGKSGAGLIDPGATLDIGPSKENDSQPTKAHIRKNGSPIEIPVGIKCVRNQTASTRQIPLSVSEPLEINIDSDGYYDQSKELLPDVAIGGITAKKFSPAFDQPLDRNNNLISALSNYANFKQVGGPVQITGVATDPDADPPASLATVYREEFKGTVGHYCTAFLQRLADPTQPYDQLSNPYVTVDLMPIDLTVYSSDGDGNQAVFASDANYNAENAGDVKDSDGTDLDLTGSYFQLGWRERTELIDPSGSLTDSTTKPTAPTGFVTESAPLPFWPNRPFVSQYELLMVPASEPGKLMLELGSHQESSPNPFNHGFPHLLNFFFQSSSEPQLGRIFDYLHVPSKYAGTQISLDPGSLSGEPGFAPPFNVISTYREPGRVNLNTIEDSEVWKAVMHGEPSAADPKSHQGPTHSSLQDTYHGPGEVSASGDTTTVAMPLLSSSLGFEGTDTNNPFLRYQPINRMGNLTTTRSNVYAVWMTLGFFETDKEGDLANPPVEAGGSDLERHRAFYMIDRSIPVGYENGHDHNTQDVFRVKRYIE